MFGIALMSLWDVWDYPDVVSSSSDEEAEVVHLVHALRAEESLKQQDYLICPFRKEVFFKATLQRMIKVISNQFPSCSMSGAEFIYRWAHLVSGAAKAEARTERTRTAFIVKY